MAIDNLIVGLISILVAFLIFYLGLNTRRPKLIIRGGGGSGGGPNSVQCENISITNDPRFFGMRLDRQAAKITYAYLKDKKQKTNYHLRGNWPESASPNTQSETSIEAGETKALNLFVYNESGNGYYVCGQNPREIDSDISPCFSDPKKQFTLYIRDKLEREYRFDFLVEIEKANMRQDMSIRNVITLPQRLGMVKEAVLLFLSAFKPAKFH